MSEMEENIIYWYGYKNQTRLVGHTRELVNQTLG